MSRVLNVFQSPELLSGVLCPYYSILVVAPTGYATQCLGVFILQTLVDILDNLATFNQNL